MGKQYKSDAHYLADQMKGLKGATVADIAAFTQDDGFGEEHWLGIVLIAKNGDVVQLTVSQDPEGNGPGFLFVDVRDKMDKRRAK